jgi:hypothetical protein
MKWFMGLFLLAALLGTASPLSSQTSAQTSSQTDNPGTHGPLPVSPEPSSDDARLAVTMLSLRESTEILAPARNARAAYSLDSQIAEAQIADDHVRIWGRAPGHAVIVLVYSDFSTDSMEVTVTQAPPILPERLWSGLNPAGSIQGYYEIRASTDPAQIGETLDYQTGRMQVHFTNVTAPNRNLPGTSSTWFPYDYLRLTGDGWRVTLLDESGDSSPISVGSALIRGIHLDAGGFAIHAGYASVAGFNSLLLPAQKQMLSGATFAQNLSGHLQVGASAYFIQHDPVALSPQTAQGLGTIFLRRRALPGACQQPAIPCGAIDFGLEMGYSKGFGGAFDVGRDTERDQFHITGRYRPQLYASPEVDNLKGLQSQANWDHLWNRELRTSLSGSENRIFTLTGRQAIEVATANVQYATVAGIAVSPGVSLSHFSQDQSLSPDVNRLALPLTVSHDGRRWGESVQYTYSVTSHAFSAGQGYEGSLHWNGQRFHFNVGAGSQTEALGIDSVFSAFPELNVELAQLGFGTAVSVGQLAQLLNSRAFLNSLGIAPNATLQLVARNWHGNINASWNWSRQTLELDSNYNLNSFLTSRNTTVLESVHYRRGLSNSTELIGSFTLLESVAPIHHLNPIAEISLRHDVGKSLFPRWRQPHGAIWGAVRLEDNGETRPLANVVIRLDGDRRTVTNSSGSYLFSNVELGVHTVRIEYKTERPFWYTTPSQVSADPGSAVDFGIVYPAAQIIGYVHDDTGAGLPGIGVSIRGPAGQSQVTADQAGKFVAPVTQSGTYVADVNVETVRAGYALDDLNPLSIPLSTGESKKINFTLPAIRALAGKVQSYDASRGEYVPVANAVVRLEELKRQAISDSSGRYLFRNLPRGLFTISVNGQAYDQVDVNASPQLLRKDISLNGKTIRDRSTLTDIDNSKEPEEPGP